MSWHRAYEGVCGKLRTDSLPTRDLERLALEIPILEPDFNRAIVGAALGRVLSDRYATEWVELPDADVFARAFTGLEEYRDRVDRARSDAGHAILDARHGDPFDTFDYAGNVSEAPEGAWFAHLRTFYGLESNHLT